jgi:hypothetical protein
MLVDRPWHSQRDRLDHISAIGEPWKEQTLLNVVRLRYGDAPNFAGVSSVISGYTFQAQVAAGATISSDLTVTIPSSLVTIGGNATYPDRPTITYTPLAGDTFARSLLRPLSPSEVLELIQAGYPAGLRCSGAFAASVWSNCGITRDPSGRRVAVASRLLASAVVGRHNEAAHNLLVAGRPI